VTPELAPQPAAVPLLTARYSAVGAPITDPPTETTGIDAGEAPPV
jgi:hypothetical protein